MRKWDLETSSAQLRDALEELQMAWRDTGDHWEDSVSQSFCETYLEPMGPAIKKTQEAVARMQQLLDHVYRDCES